MTASEQPFFICVNSDTWRIKAVDELDAVKKQAHACQSRYG